MLDQEQNLVSGAVEIQAARALLDWLNTFGAFPERVASIEA